MPWASCVPYQYQYQEKLEGIIEPPREGKAIESIAAEPWPPLIPINSPEPVIGDIGYRSYSASARVRAGLARISACGTKRTITTAAVKSAFDPKLTSTRSASWDRLRSMALDAGLAHEILRDSPALENILHSGSPRIA